MAELDRLLKFLRDQGGSDLHLIAGYEPRIRNRGALDLVPGMPVLKDRNLRVLLEEIATDKQMDDFHSNLELDFAYSIPGVARFRANMFNQEHGIAAVFRLIPENIQTLDSLGAPKAIEQFVHLNNGLVLVTGPTGSGKSTTLAAIINEINAVHPKHIVTIEDPIEFVHKPKQCMITQREVGTHTKSFEAALRAAIRQNPDVILVGELRDSEIELAITAAEMGALVFGTLHTNSAAKTIDRMIDAFPADRQDQIRLSLSEALYGVVSQLLIPSADGSGRVAAHEILVRTSGLGNMIREGSTAQLMSVIQGGRNQGMQTMDDSLADLLKNKLISGRDAFLKAEDKTRFESHATRGTR